MHDVQSKLGKKSDFYRFNKCKAFTFKAKSKRVKTIILFVLTLYVGNEDKWNLVNTFLVFHDNTD